MEGRSKGFPSLGDHPYDRGAHREGSDILLMSLWNEGREMFLTVATMGFLFLSVKGKHN